MSEGPRSLVLASASPRRSELLRRMGLAFEVAPAGVEETDDASRGAAVMVTENAKRKARAVADRRPEALVLGADTTVELDGAVLGKPADRDAARRTLWQLSGRWHAVHTGVALIWRGGGEEHVFAETSGVLFRALDDAAIDAYLRRVNPLDKAGAYGIQEAGEWVVAEVEGSAHNVMGLPTEQVDAWLDAVGYRF